MSKLKQSLMAAGAVGCLSLGFLIVGTAVSAEETAKTTTATTTTTEVKEQHKHGGETCSITDPSQKEAIKFECTNALPACAESEKVIQTLSLYAKAYVSQDYKTCAEYMTDNITTFDMRKNKLITGKEAVLADMKARLERSAPGTESPLLSYTIDHPLAQVKGNKACVNCIGIKVYGGKHPRKMESHSNYVFVKEDGKWKKSHFTTDWKRVSN